MKEHTQRNSLKKNVVNVAIDFIRLKFDRKLLKGTIDYEISKAIQEAMIYYVNILGEEI